MTERRPRTDLRVLPDQIEGSGGEVGGPTPGDAYDGGSIPLSSRPAPPEHDPEISMDDFEMAILDADDSFCHIKQAGYSPAPFLCGQGYGPRHIAGAWSGADHCAACGKPGCPDCLAIAKAWL